MNKNKKNQSEYGFSFKDYIRILENPNKIGLNNGIWSAPILKGYDKNQRGYGIDINTNKKAKALTNNRPGRWLTEREADTLMDDHINYITEAANKHIKGFSELPFRRKWALLGMLYRGDSVNKSGININEPDDLKFFKSISDYYRSKGLNTRANSSDKFFNRPVSKLLSMFKLKQGGKMNILEFLKNGSGIHIKEKNKGSFTRWCGGNVTEECIRRGKASSNPKIRRKATFADNARRWKHKDGGKAFVNGVSILDSNPDAYKYVKKKYKMHLYGGEIINDSPIVTSHLNWIQGMSDYLLKKRELDELKKELELLKKLLESDMISNILGTAFNYGMDYFANKTLSKNGVPVSKNKVKSNIISSPPKSSNETFTSKIGLTGTIDEWRKAMQV